MKTCAWRFTRLSELVQAPGNATATGTNRGQLVIQLLPQAIPAGALPAPHAFDGRYRNVENRFASPPARLWSRIRCGILEGDGLVTAHKQSEETEEK